MWILIILLATASVLLASWFITGWMRRYALASSLLDVPNERSSHQVPTPRGGGLAVAIVVLGSLPLLSVIDRVEWSVSIALMGAGAVVAGIGFLDDHRHVAARWRLICHFLAAGWALTWVGGMPPIAILEFRMEVSPVAQVLALLYLVWVVNLFNFMDGIDGIAALEVATVCFGAGILYLCTGIAGFGVLEWLLGFAVLGFLIWNFPPARIFLGDAGSGFLGIASGVMSLHAAWQAPQLWWSWLILLGVFLVDATFTLLRRLLAGEPAYQAHRVHAYQKASRRFGAHLPVTVAVGMINLCWLLPLALMVALGTLDGLVGLTIAYAPLVGVSLWLGAGQEESEHAPY